MKPASWYSRCPNGSGRGTVTLPERPRWPRRCDRRVRRRATVAVPWDADVGIFGELCERDAVPRDGDRIEIYRPLKSDPKVSRRARAAARRAAPDRAASRPRLSVDARRLRRRRAQSAASRPVMRFQKLGLRWFFLLAAMACAGRARAARDRSASARPDFRSAAPFVLEIHGQAALERLACIAGS